MNFRLLAATNRDLSTRIEEGEFRDDLYFRLAVISIHVPPLRERRADIPPLVEQFASEICDDVGVQRHFQPDVVEYLGGQDWRGNVRELRNAVERAIMMSRGKQIGMDDVQGVGVPFSMNSSAGVPDLQTLDELLTKFEVTTDGGNTLTKLERMIIELAMKEANGNVSKAARTLGMQRKTLERKLKKMLEEQEALSAE